MKKRLFLILIAVIGFTVQGWSTSYFKITAAVADQTGNVSSSPMGKVYVRALTYMDWRGEPHDNTHGWYRGTVQDQSIGGAGETGSTPYVTVSGRANGSGSYNFVGYALFARPIQGYGIYAWGQMTSSGTSIVTSNNKFTGQNNVFVSGLGLSKNNNTEANAATTTIGAVFTQSTTAPMDIEYVTSETAPYTVQYNCLQSDFTDKIEEKSLNTSISTYQGDIITLTLKNTEPDYQIVEWCCGNDVFATGNPYKGIVTDGGIVSGNFLDDTWIDEQNLSNVLSVYAPTSSNKITAKFAPSVKFLTGNCRTYAYDSNSNEIVWDKKRVLTSGDQYRLVLDDDDVSGYEFWGWYLEKADGTKTCLSTESDATVTITEAGNVYADMVKTTWDAKWMNGETVLKTSGECDSEEQLPEYTDALPTSTGKTFVGWAKSVDHHSITYSAVFVDNASAPSPTVVYSAADGNITITKPTSLTNVTDYIVKLSDIESALTTALSTDKKASSIDITEVASVYKDDGSATATASEIQTQMVTSTSNQNVLTYVPVAISGASSATNVIQNGECSSLVLTDGGTDAAHNPFNVPFEFSTSQVTYTRNSTATWGTIILPYAPVAKTGYTYYTLSNADLTNNKLTFTPVTDALEANTPYLYQNTTGSNYDASTTSSVTLPVTGETSTTPISNWTMNGVYKRTTVFSSTSHANYASCTNEKVVDANSYYIKADGSAFAKINGSFNINAFRAYLTTTDGVGAAKLLNFSIDDTPTGVEFIENEDKTVDVIFDMSGRKLSEPQKNAVNIINGKKVLVK